MLILELQLTVVVVVVVARSSGGGVRQQGYEELELPQKVGPGGAGWAETSLQEKSFGGGTPDSLPEIDRPKLRHIDKYVRAECPCLSKRYTVAVLTCVGECEKKTMKKTAYKKKT